jgi:mannosyltransferase OCH1-like enzyme
LVDATFSKLCRRSSETPQNRTPEQPIRGARSARLVPDTSQQAGSIPKIVFQTWKTRQPPTNFTYWSTSFQRLNPDFQHVLWDDADNREFIASDYPWFLTFYDSYPREIFRADIVRFFFLYRFGGLYADLDTECLRPLGQTLARADIVLGRMGNDPTFPHSIPNAMMASAPGQLFWLLAIAIAIERIIECGNVQRMDDNGPEQLTGPILLRDAVDW